MKLPPQLQHFLNSPQFQQVLAVIVGLLVATGWLLAAPYVTDRDHALGAIALVASSAAAMARFRISPMWLVGAGAVVGALGWV